MLFGFECFLRHFLIFVLLILSGGLHAQVFNDTTNTNAANYLNDAYLLNPSASSDLNLENFDLSFDQEGVHSVHGAYVPKHLSYDFTGILKITHNPLLLRNELYERQAALVQDRGVFDLNASLALFERLSLKLQIPITLFQTSNLNFDSGLASRLGLSNGLSSFGFGDISLGAKIRLLRVKPKIATIYRDEGLNLSLLLHGVLPTSMSFYRTGWGFDRGSTFNTVGNTMFRANAKALLSYRRRAFHTHFNLGYVFIPPTLVADAIAFGPRIDLRGALAYDWIPKRTSQLAAKLTRLVTSVELLAQTPDRTPFGLFAPNQVVRDQSWFSTPVEFLGALRWVHPSGLQPEIAVGSAMTQGLGAPDFRVHLGLRYANPGARTRFNYPFEDRDGDGIHDEIDGCPDDAEDLDEFEDEDGCPEDDNDKDGIPDARDLCMNVAGSPENYGCPFEDSDGDSIMDENDRCPEHAGPVMFAGCPDRDSDGIPDIDDECPDVKETINGFEDEDGCPDEGARHVIIHPDHIEVRERIYFDFARDKIKPRSFGLLDEIALSLKAYPNLRIRVVGHTDSEASEEYNQILSEARANAVKEYLIHAGVAPERLESRGYGELIPSADNRSEEGRSQNRRVEFFILNELSSE